MHMYGGEVVIDDVSRKGGICDQMAWSVVHTCAHKFDFDVLCKFFLTHYFHQLEEVLLKQILGLLVEIRDGT